MHPVFPNSKVPRPEVMTNLFDAVELVTLTEYFIETVCPNIVKEAIGKSLLAVMGKLAKFLKGLLSSTSFSSSFFGLILLIKSSYLTKVNLSEIFLAKSAYSFSLYFSSFAIISDFISYFKSLGPKIICPSSGST